jgi:hypothetical protein
MSFSGKHKMPDQNGTLCEWTMMHFRAEINLLEI